MLRNRKLVAVMVLVFALVIGVVSVSAQGSRAYIQINNGRTISVTGTEQPQVVVQFGNRGRQGIEDVRVLCDWNNTIRFNGQAQVGPFGSSQFFPPNQGITVNGERRPQLNFPATTIIDPAQLTDLPAGQNHNVAFGIRFALPDPGFKGAAGELRCFLLDANFGVLAQSAATQVVIR